MNRYVAIILFITAFTQLSAHVEGGSDFAAEKSFEEILSEPTPERSQGEKSEERYEEVKNESRWERSRER